LKEHFRGAFQICRLKHNPEPNLGPHITTSAFDEVIKAAAEI